jgi:hypothetical protein
MKLQKNYFFLVAMIATGVLLQACWKDKTLKDKELFDVHANISPAYGIPLVNLDIQGKDIVMEINKDSATHDYVITYDQSDYDLCVITYDKTNLLVELSSLPVLTLDTSLTYALDFFSDLRRDGWKPKQAFLSLYVDNDYDANLTLNLQALTYENGNGLPQPVTGDSINSKIHPISFSADGQPKRSLAVDELSVINPSDIVFKGTKLTIDFSVTADRPPTYGSRLNLNPIIKVPAYFTLDGFARRDTTSVNLSELTKIFNDTSALALQDVTFYLSITNGMPLTGKAQVYFADANYRILDSILMEEIDLKPGIPDASFRVQTPVVTTAEITMSEEKFNKIKDAKYLIFKESLYSYRSEDVKLFKSNFLKILLSCKINTKLNGKLSDVSY